LEAISGMSSPAKDNLCTHFPTELFLRRDGVPGIEITIIPGPEKTAAERVTLTACRPSIDVDRLDERLGHVVESAKQAMGFSDTKAFSTDAGVGAIGVMDGVASRLSPRMWNKHLPNCLHATFRTR
ncbi:hypothetical protein GE09DRAFT_980138, partial [Coniochaeta sp. 2T2.1]